MTALLHYPDVLLARPTSPYVIRIRGAILAAAVLEYEMLAWSVSIRQAFDARPDQADSKHQTSELVALLHQQTTQISQLLEQQKHYEERLRALVWWTHQRRFEFFISDRYAGCRGSCD